MSGLKTRISLAHIRDVLAYVDETSGYHAAKKYGYCPKTVYRWIHYRDADGGCWPTDADIAAWEDAERALRDKRDVIARRARSYRKRRYLNRGLLGQPSVGTQRRLHALMAIGHAYTDIAVRLGLSSARVWQLATRGTVVLPPTAAAVSRVYDELCMVVPTGWIADRQRRLAASRGYPPPLAWDDIDTDEKPYQEHRRGDPDLVDDVVVQRRLDGVRTRHLTRAETREVLRRGRARRLTVADLERRGLKPDRYREAG